MAAGQQVTFEPTLALVLAQHLHHPAIRADMVIDGNDFRSRAAVCHLETGVPTVRCGFVRAEDAEVACISVELEHIADELTLNARAFSNPLRRALALLLHSRGSPAFSIL